MLPIDLKDRRAFVTGVSSGIGLGISRMMARAGCHVAGCARNAPGYDGVRQFIQCVESEGREAHYFEADVSCAGQISSVVTRASEALGGLDFVISNAGRNVFKGASDCTEADWSQCLELDLASHWRVAKAARPFLQKSAAPAIIVISSNHSKSTIPGCFPYNVAKAGLSGLVQSLAIEWGPAIRAVGIAPGFIDTPGNDAWFQSFPDAEAERRRTEKLHPAGRLGTVEEVGALCAFLCSSHAAFVTGVTWLVDGGRSALMQDG